MKNGAIIQSAKSADFTAVMDVLRRDGETGWIIGEAQVYQPPFSTTVSPGALPINPNG